jgi:hypothetical protein
MSFVFYIPSKKSITKGWLFKQLLNEDEHSKHSNAILDETQLDEGEKLHRPGRSTRGASVYRGEKGYEVSLSVLASIADWQLAVKAAITIAEFAEDLIQPENHPEMKTSAFKELVTDSWITEQALQGVNVITTLIGEGKGPITLFGYRGDYAIGKKLLRQLGIENNDEKTVFEKLVAHFTEHQNSLQNYFIPSRYQVDGPVGGKPEPAIIWSPEIASYIYKADWIFVSINIDSKNTIYKIKYNQILPILSGDSHFKLIDETNFLAEVFSPEELKDLADQLAKIADDITVKENEVKQDNEQEMLSEKKPWWKLW